jgi:hypothetical protein
MKYTKKVVSVPESEYQALLSLFSGNDPMKKEKFLTDKKIAENFTKPKLTPLERGAKYQSLARKRRILNKKIEDKPIKVLMEQSRAAVMPTTGIFPAAKTEQRIQDVQQEQQQRQQEEVAPAEPEAEEEEVEAAPKTVSDLIEKYHASIAKKFARKLNDLIEANKKKLGINYEGKIYLNMNKKAYSLEEKSDYKNILAFLIGGTDSPSEKKSTLALIKRLQKIDEFNELVEQTQEGGGKRKRYVVSLGKNAIKTAKTKGLTRFKPQLWTKIPV